MHVDIFVDSVHGWVVQLESTAQPLTQTHIYSSALISVFSGLVLPLLSLPLAPPGAQQLLASL